LVATYNRGVGGVRIIQKRAVKENCGLSEDINLYLGEEEAGKCHAWNSYSEETFGPPGKSFWDKAFVGGSEIRGETKDNFVAWVMFTRSPERNQKRLDSLTDGRWMDDMTLHIESQGVFYNAETKMYAFLRLPIEFLKSGEIRPMMDVRVISSDQYPDYLYILPDVFWVVLLLVMLVQELIQIKDDYMRGWLFRYYLTDFWNIIDWLTIVMGFVIVTIFWYNYGWLLSLEDKIRELGPAP
jgi:hypothetical protein